MSMPNPIAKAMGIICRPRFELLENYLLAKHTDTPPDVSEYTDNISSNACHHAPSYCVNSHNLPIQKYQEIGTG